MKPLILLKRAYNAHSSQESHLSLTHTQKITSLVGGYVTGKRFSFQLGYRLIDKAASIHQYPAIFKR